MRIQNIVKHNTKWTQSVLRDYEQVINQNLHTVVILAVSFKDLCQMSREWKRFPRTSQFASAEMIINKLEMC